MRINDNSDRIAWSQLREAWLQVAHLHNRPPFFQSNY